MTICSVLWCQLDPLESHCAHGSSLARHRGIQDFCRCNNIMVVVMLVLLNYKDIMDQKDFNTRLISKLCVLQGMLCVDLYSGAVSNKPHVFY